MPLNASSTMSYAISVAASITKDTGTLGKFNMPQNFPGGTQAFSIGAGANGFNYIYGLGGATVAAGAPVTTDLTALTAIDGSAVTFADILGIAIRNQSTSGGNLVVGDAASQAWADLLGATGTITIRPGYIVFLAAAVATGYVIDGTHNNLKFLSSAGTCTYDWMIWGH